MILFWLSPKNVHAFFLYTNSKVLLSIPSQLFIHTYILFLQVARSSHDMTKQMPVWKIWRSKSFYREFTGLAGKVVRHGSYSLTPQTFRALVTTLRSQALLVEELFQEGYEFVMMRCYGHPGDEFGSFLFSHYHDNSKLLLIESPSFMHYYVIQRFWINIRDVTWKLLTIFKYCIFFVTETLQSGTRFFIRNDKTASSARNFLIFIPFLGSKMS